MTDTFPVLTYRYEKPECRIGVPASVPWALVAPHERQAVRNHGGQSLVRLAERGGLGLSELAAVLEDRPWRSMQHADALAVVRGRLAAFEAAS